MEREREVLRIRSRKDGRIEAATSWCCQDTVTEREQSEREPENSQNEHKNKS